MKILVVEDSKKLQKSLRAGLRRLGYAVDVAADGVEGAAFAMHGEYDVVVLDLMLPRKSGLEVLRDIRASKRNTEVLILSARDQTRDRIAGLQQGADDWLSNFARPTGCTTTSRSDCQAGCRYSSTRTR